jgi:hypothetical protein
MAADQPPSWHWLVTLAMPHDMPATLSNHHKATQGRRPGFLTSWGRCPSFLHARRQERAGVKSQDSHIWQRFEAPKAMPQGRNDGKPPHRPLGQSES